MSATSKGPRAGPGRRRRVSWGASVARCPPDRAYLTKLGSESHTVIVGICRLGPVTAVPCRAKTIPLPRASSLFRPPRSPRTGLPVWGIWWRRRVLPPGPLRLFRTAFIAIVGDADSRNIGSLEALAKGWPHRSGTATRAGVGSGSALPSTGDRHPLGETSARHADQALQALAVLREGGARAVVDDPPTVHHDRALRELEG